MSRQDNEDSPQSPHDSPEGGLQNDPASPETSSRKSGGRAALLVSGGLFGLYALNVLSGKISTTSEVTIPLNLGDVGEFLTLFAAAICFVIAALQREAAN